MSQIIGSLLPSVDPKRYDPKKPMPLEKIEKGMHFERVLEQMFKKALPGVFRPPPICCEGVWCSPDGIQPDIWAPVEIKLTWYSSRKECPIHEVYWPWKVQVAAYAYALESLTAFLYPQFVNGNYAPPTPAPLIPYRLDFSETEVLENWAMLKNQAKRLGWL